MRLFKTHRGPGSHANSPDGSTSPRDPSPTRPPTHYPQGHPRAQSQFDGANDRPDQVQPQPQPRPANAPDYLQSRPLEQPSFPRDSTAAERRPVATVTAIPLSEAGRAYEEQLHQRIDPANIEKEGNRKRSILSNQPNTREVNPNPPRLIGRSVSIRGRTPPKPSIDTSGIDRRFPQPRSAIDAPFNRGQGYLDPAFLDEDSATSPNPVQQHFNDYRTSSAYGQSQTSLNYSNEGVPQPFNNQDRDSPRQEYQEPSIPNQNIYTSHHYSKPSDQSSLSSHDAYRIRPGSQQSVGPPSPVFSHAQLAEARDPRPEHSQPYETTTQGTGQLIMPNRDGQTSAPRHSTQAPPNGHGQDQYSQYANSLQPPQRPSMTQQVSSQAENGRATPPPTSKGDLSSIDVAALVQKHEELQAKYSKVKKYYFEKEAQVKNLQDTVANQRLSMSNTSLDDSEYQTRFNRLDGAITNLAFNIRKEWRAIPPWLQTVVNKDATPKETLAVGRACITRWLVDELFDRLFHPGLEVGLSSQLKIIERNIRRSAHRQAAADGAQRDDSVAKLSNWRLTTIEGLQEMLSSAQAQEYRSQLTANLIDKLTAALQMNLREPSPPELDSGIGTIVELAVGISANIPMESRDVCLEYFMPGAFIVDTYMKLETTLPPLSNPLSSNEMFGFSGNDLNDDARSAGTDSPTDKDYSPESDRDMTGNVPPRTDSLSAASQRELNREKKKSIFGGLVTKKPTPSDMLGGPGGPTSGQQQRTGGASISTAPGSLPQQQKDRDSAERQQAAADRERRIRFAAFLTVEVRTKGQKEGGNVLVRASCFGF